MSDARSDTPLRLGFIAGGDARRIAWYESLPIDSLWVGGHVASPNPSGEAMVALGRLCALTERVRVGTSILLLPLYPPALVAKQIADLDRTTGGRLILGIGVGGEYPQEFRACQVPVEERGARTNEAIPLLRTLWTAEPVTHAGRFYAMDDVRIHPSPVQPGGPPILVAGRREAAMRRAATLGDGWLPYLYSPRRYAASVSAITDLAAAAGRDLNGFGWYVFVFVNIDPDGQRARSDAAGAIGGMYNQDVTEMVDNVAVAGTPAEAVERLTAFVDAGARHFIFCPVTRTEDNDVIVRRVVEDVFPAVQTYAAAAIPTAPH